MKKLFLAALIASAGVSSLSAQSILNDNGTYFKLMPACYAKDGKAKVYSYLRTESEGEYSNNDYRFRVYDENMSLVKDFSIGFPEKVEAEYNYQQRKYVPKDISVNIHVVEEFAQDNFDQDKNYDIDQMLEFVRNIWGDEYYSIYTLPDGKKVIGGKDIEYYGVTYPPYGFVKEGNKWYYAEIYLTGDNYGNYGEWGEVETRSETRYAELEDLYIVPECGGDDQYYRLTNGILGDGFAYIRPRLALWDYSREEKYDDGFVYRKEWGKNIVVVGYDVYDDKNSKIASFDVPAGYIGYSDLYFYKMGENRFIVVDIENSSTGEYAKAIYKLDGNSSIKFSPVDVIPSMKVMPGAPKRGQKVQVSLDAPVVKDSKVQVVSVAGKMMYQGAIAAGNNIIDIDTHDFTSGMYVVSVVNAEGSREAAKIIVR